MRRILKLLTYLYPSDWRKRYEAEYLELLEQQTPSVWDVLDSLWAVAKMHTTQWSSARIILPSILLGGIIAAGISFSAPPQYISQTAILTTSTGASQASLDPLLSDTSLLSVIETLDLYPNERVRISQDALIRLIRKNISLKHVASGSGKDTFVLSFSYPDLRTAQRVNAELISAIVTSNLRLRLDGSPRAFSGTMRVENTTNATLNSSIQSRLFIVHGMLFGLIAGLMLSAGLRRQAQHKRPQT